MCPTPNEWLALIFKKSIEHTMNFGVTQEERRQVENLKFERGKWCKLEFRLMINSLAITPP